MDEAREIGLEFLFGYLAPLLLRGPIGFEQSRSGLGWFRGTMNTFRRRLLLFAERTSLAFGVVGLVCWGVFHLEVASSTRQHLERFATLQAAALHAGTPDQSLWSSARVNAWRKTLSEPAPHALAVLRIPGIGLEVPVLRGTDDHTLDHAVGHIEDTAQPGTEGTRASPGTGTASSGA